MLQREKSNVPGNFMQQTGLWVQCHSPVSVKPSCCVKPLSHRTLSHTGCQTACALQKTHCVFIKLSAWLRAMYPTARDTHMEILCQISLCDLFLGMVTHHQHTSNEPLSPCWSHQATVPDKDTLFKTQGLILKSSDIPSKTDKETVTGILATKKQWEEFYFQHPITSVRHT